MQILIGDSTPETRSEAERALRQAGHRVVSTEDGRACLEAFRGSILDLVFLDIDLPVLSGMEVVAAMRLHERGLSRHTPIIALTKDEMSSEKALKAGFDDWLTKPEDPEALGAEVLGLAVRLASTLSPSSRPPVDPGFDFEFARAEMGSIFTTVADLLCRDVPPCVAELHEAYAAKDAARVARLAHRLAGTVGNFSAPEALRLTRELEVAAKTGRLENTDVLVQQATQAVECLRDSLAAMIQSSSTK